MRAVFFVALCIVPCSQAVKSDAASGGNPLDKAIEFLTDLQSKISKDGESEANAYRRFFQWCSDASLTLQQQIKELKRQIVNNNAAIEEASSDFDDAVTQIDVLTKTVNSNEARLKQTTAVRRQEKDDFKVAEREFMEAIDMIGRAIGILEKNAEKKVVEAKGSALIQDASGIPAEVIQTLTILVDAVSLESEDRAKLAALLQDGSTSDDDDVGAPAAEAYKAHTANIVEVMTNMRAKASAQLKTARDEETKSQHNYDLLSQSLTDQTANAQENLDNQNKYKADATQRKALAEGDLAIAQKQLKEAEESLKKTQADCMQTAADHEASIKARDEELKKLKEAQGIIMQNVQQAAAKTYSFVQVSSRSHAHLNAEQQLAGKQVISIVKKVAADQHSTKLAQLASKLSAVMKYGNSNGADPFVKVKGLIREMIARFEKDLTAAAKEKQYCDRETAKTEKRKGDLEDEVKDLKAKIDKAASESTTLKREVKDLQRDLRDLAAEQSEMDKAREEMHKAFVETRDDLQQGLTGLQSAIRVMKEYYGADTGGDTALVQTSDGDSEDASDDSEDAAPALVQTDETSDSDTEDTTVPPPGTYGQGGHGYTSQHGEEAPVVVHFTKSTGAGSDIIGLFQILESDIAKNLASVETEEDSQQTEYDKTTQQNKVTKATKTKDIEYKTKQFTGLDKDITDLSSDIATSKEELQAVVDYYTKLNERCIEKPEKFEERQARRQAEIDGLKEAKAVLDGLQPTSFLSRGNRHLRKRR